MKTKLLLCLMFFFGLLSGLSARHQMDSTGIKPFHRFYVSWGYTKCWFSNSTIHFKGSVNNTPYDFEIQHARAHDKPDMKALFPEVTVPQYVFRIGFFFDKKRQWAIELNYDHAKYIVTDFQTAHVKGSINNSPVDANMVLNPMTFVHFEHTNGANFYLINGVRRFEIWKSRRHIFRLNNMVKAGFGWMIPKTDVTLFGKRLDNKFHVAGYMFGIENSLRLNLGRWFFIEPSIKGAYVDYRDVFTVEGGKAHHSFWVFEAMGTIGFSFL